jgi:hypothetical protein
METTSAIQRHARVKSNENRLDISLQANRPTHARNKCEVNATVGQCQCLRPRSDTARGGVTGGEASWVRRHSNPGGGDIRSTSTHLITTRDDTANAVTKYCYCYCYDGVKKVK